MLIRTEEIIERQNELEELKKLEVLGLFLYGTEKWDLFHKTLYEKRKQLEELYEKQMKLYLENREKYLKNMGVSNDTDTK